MFWGKIRLGAVVGWMGFLKVLVENSGSDPVPQFVVSTGINTIAVDLF